MRTLLWTTLLIGIGSASISATAAPQAQQDAQVQAPPAEAPRAAPPTAAVPTGFLFKSLDVDGTTYACCVYVPPEYTPTKAWPVILFLHGSGERGSDGLLQTDVGIARAIRRDRSRVPAIVVMPQCPAKEQWSGPPGLAALRCLEATTREYTCDLSRIYITGLSLGGNGAWMLSAAAPNVFAAAAPICGFTGAERADEVATAVKDLPIWIFHGDQDTAVPVEESRHMAALLRANQAPSVKYTEYAGGGHGIWDRVYEDPEFWNWLFAQRREKPAPGVEVQKGDKGG